MTQTAQSEEFNSARADDYIARGLEHLWIHSQQYNTLANDDGLLVFKSGDGIYLTDAKGRRFIDALAGIWVVAVGHGRTELADVARAQMATLGYANPFEYATEPAVDLATKLAEITPSSITRSYFVNSGAEAVETAIRMAKQYHYNRGEPKRYKVISRDGSYHGITAGAMAATRASYTNRVPFEPLQPGSIGVANVDCDHCPYEKTYPECDVFCARTIERTIEVEGPSTIAAMIAEPISTANGCYVPPPEYWRTLRELCDKHGIVLIADEVINGFGRTGKMFGMQHFPVEPDIMTVAKGLSSGYVPIAATMVSQRIADAFRGEPADALVGGNTFGAHPVACAVALANLGIIERENLVENSARMGEHLAEQLQALSARHPSVAYARGIGLMHNLELMRNPETNEAFRPEDAIDKRVTEALKANGVIGRPQRGRVSIAPSLIINREEIDTLVDLVDGAITQVEQDLGIR